MKFYYEISLVSFSSNPKDLDLSYKMDLDFFGLFWKGNRPVLLHKKCGNSNRQCTCRFHKCLDRMLNLNLIHKIRILLLFAITEVFLHCIHAAENLQVLLIFLHNSSATQ